MAALSGVGQTAVAALPVPAPPKGWQAQPDPLPLRPRNAALLLPASNFVGQISSAPNTKVAGWQPVAADGIATRRSVEAAPSFVVASASEPTVPQGWSVSTDPVPGLARPPADQQSYPPQGNVPTAPTPQGWGVQFDVPPQRPRPVADQTACPMPSAPQPRGWQVVADVAPHSQRAIDSNTGFVPPPRQPYGWQISADTPISLRRLFDTNTGVIPAPQAVPTGWQGQSPDSPVVTVAVHFATQSFEPIEPVPPGPATLGWLGSADLPLRQLRIADAALAWVAPRFIIDGWRPITPDLFAPTRPVEAGTTVVVRPASTPTGWSLSVDTALCRSGTPLDQTAFVGFPATVPSGWQGRSPEPGIAAPVNAHFASVLFEPIEAVPPGPAVLGWIPSVDQPRRSAAPLPEQSVVVVSSAPVNTGWLPRFDVPALPVRVPNGAITFVIPPAPSALPTGGHGAHRKPRFSGRPIWDRLPAAAPAPQAPKPARRAHAPKLLEITVPLLERGPFLAAAALFDAADRINAIAFVDDDDEALALLLGRAGHVPAPAPDTEDDDALALRLLLGI